MLILVTAFHTLQIFQRSLTDFQNFPGPVTFFQDFPVLENAIIKFQDFPGFPGRVRTLIVLQMGVYAATTDLADLFSTMVPNIRLQPTDSQSTRLLYK